MHTKLLTLLVVVQVGLPGIAIAQTTGSERVVGHRIVEKFGTIVYRYRWKTRTIDVCWENIGATSDKNKKLVQDAVASTWEAYSRIKFRWMPGSCADKQPGVHIQVGPVRPRTEKLGARLDGVENGMKLNFDPSTYARLECTGREDACIKAMAVHEFGHALAFTHEQNRSDAPKECRDEHASGSVGDYFVTKYDPKSIMNYCEPLWEGDGNLSSLDQAAVKAIYP